MGRTPVWNRIVAALMLVQGVSIIGMWGAFIYGGVFRNGLRTVENNMYLGLHVLAEFMMGALLIAGSIGLLANCAWGRVVSAVGIGSVIYSTVNSMADTVRNKPNLTPILFGNLVLAVLMAIALVRRR
jgi:hypothetical protein